MRLLIIGNGIAALSAAESYRKLHTENEIIMLSDEPYLTYQRIKLSHMLGHEHFEAEDILVKPLAWYEEKQINIKLNSKVTHIDFENKSVKLESGKLLGYDQLLIANGGHAFMPPVKCTARQGVFALRSFEDLKLIRNYLKDKRNVLIIGGGLLGLEAAQGLLELGKSVEVLEFFPYLLPRQLDQELSQVVQTQLEKEGIRFILGKSCEEVLGTEAVTGVRLGDGTEIVADAIIFSAGVRPNIDLYKGSALNINKGIVVNDHMQTNLPNVYAAGDIAEYNGVVFGLWIAANEHGRIAGSNLAGKEMTYAAPQLVTTLNIGEVKMFSAGDIADPEETLTYREGNAFHKLFIKQGHVVGGVLTGDLSLMLKVKNMVSKKEAIVVSDGWQL